MLNDELYPRYPASIFDDISSVKKEAIKSIKTSLEKMGGDIRFDNAIKDLVVFFQPHRVTWTSDCPPPQDGRRASVIQIPHWTLHPPAEG